MSAKNKLVNALIEDIFVDPSAPFAIQFADWIAESSRFREFAETYRTKIRKKVRSAHDAQRLEDLRIELETAFLLLQERQFALAYEQYGVGKTRSPDFTVTFRTHTLFNVEVARLRDTAARRDLETAIGASANAQPLRDEAGRQINRLIDLVCGKLGQMQPGVSNLLFVSTTSQTPDLEGTMAHLRERAERRDTALFSRAEFDDATDFFKHYLRLSGLLVRSASNMTPSTVSLWINKQAKHPLAPKICSLLQRIGA
jgi:hypothetical protein